METNNSSGKNINQQNVGSSAAQKDVTESANENKNYNNQHHLNKGKATGMSSEANSTQSEESWQGTGGSSMSNAQQKSYNQGNGSMHLSGNNNQSAQDESVKNKQQAVNSNTGKNK